MPKIIIIRAALKTRPSPEINLIGSHGDLSLVVAPLGHGSTVVGAASYGNDGSPPWAMLVSYGSATKGATWPRQRQRPKERYRPWQ